MDREDCCLPYDLTNQKAKTEGYTHRATLQKKPPSGYVSIEVNYGKGNKDSKSGDSNIVVTVNEQRLYEKLPVGRYQIPAGIPVKIRAVNPFEKVSAEETVIVGIGQKKAVKLNLTRQASSNH